MASTRSTLQPPLEKHSATTLEQRYFVSAQLFAREQQEIFARSWLLAGHVNDIPNPGDYFLANVAGESLIIVRDATADVRACYNVCRHRGTRICENESGSVRILQCPYHNWSYGLDGRLLAAPHMDEVTGFSKDEYSLAQVNVGVWEGFIFVSLEPDQLPLSDWFAPLTGKFSPWNLARLNCVRRITYDVRANWKLIFQNYSECYHCPGVHPALSKLTPYDSAENDLCEGPFLGGFMPIRRGHSLTLSGNASARPVGDVPSEYNHRVLYYSIFPNMLLSMHPDYVMVHQVWPRATDRTLIFCDWLFHPNAAGSSNYNPEDAIEFWDMTNKQDWHVCELSQQGIASRAYKPGPYSSRESIPAAWDREYLRHMS
ncbi:MAG: aromatic ring-hydroxylating dioxygenase subunit alpha [Verrucomicrobia bacterium]|nr:aromatic ring-hydroxylating dioxygenase subunit alpha [Verrucomicrobiota bacterium]